MKKYVGRIILLILVLAVGLWLIDRIPFYKDIDQQVTAGVYKFGDLMEETTVTIKGTKTCYLFEPDRFTGEFRIPYVEFTETDGLTTRIIWDGSNVQSIFHHFTRPNRGGFFNQDIVHTLLISGDMKRFALMTSDQEVIATSQELCDLFNQHFTYNGKTSMTIRDIKSIPKL